MRCKAQAIYRQGGLLAYPTEAVYGLGCDPNNAEAVMRLVALKQRSLDKGLIVLAAEWAQLTQWMAPLDEVSLARLKRPSKHPVTWLVPAAKNTPYWLTGRHSTIAMRVTQFPALAELCRQCGPLISTSANPAGKTPAKTALAVRHYFPKQQIDMIIGGQLGHADRPSQIIDLLSGHVWRD